MQTKTRAAQGTGRGARPAPLSADERRLVEENVGLVRHILGRKFSGAPPGLWEDLAGEGFVALARAAQRYDPSLGFKFCTFAGRAVWSRMARLLRASHLIRVPRGSGEVPPAVVSLASLAGDGGGAYEPAAPEAEAEPETSFRARVEAALPLLRGRHAEALRLRLLEGATFDGVGRHLGVSKERARQVVKAGLRRLQQALAGVR